MKFPGFRFLKIILVLILISQIPAAEAQETGNISKIVYLPDTAPEGGFNTFRFNDSDAEICTENGKPIIFLFSKTWCPHSRWIERTFDKVAKEYVDGGKIVAHHWEFDKLDDTLTARAETSVPEFDLNVYKNFFKADGVPTFVFGCKYYRIGNAYEEENDLVAEENDFREVIDYLIRKGYCNNDSGCSYGEYCSGSKCKALKSAGESCYINSECKTRNCFRKVCREEGYCERDSGCSSGEYCSENKCMTLKPAGVSCSKDLECKTGICFKGICREEGYCDIDSDCSSGESSGEYCSNNRCRALKPIGGSCSGDSECEINNCFKSVCREKGYCDVDSDCPPGESCSDNKCGIKNENEAKTSGFLILGLILLTFLILLYLVYLLIKLW